MKKESIVTGVTGLLGVIFITLKLTGLIEWSWWWVTAPLWGGIAVAILLLVVLVPYFFVKTS